MPRPRVLEAPEAGESTHSQADYLELLALRADDRNSSLQDLVSSLRQSGTTEQLDADADSDRGSELTQQIAESAFSEVDTRSRSAGNAYPFTVHDQYIQLKSEIHENEPYVFMLLLKYFGVSAGTTRLKGASIFEEIATAAAAEYIGGADSPGVGSYHFGFPRRIAPGGFEDALNDLCQRLGEGIGAKSRPRLRQQKDAKLDLVAWRAFGDGKAGKIIAFGQCAAGDKYDAKSTELIPRKFYRQWMREPLPLEPLLFFFVPGCVDDEEWYDLICGDLVLFDRCRVASLAATNTMDSELVSRIRRWNQNVLNGQVRT